MNKPETRERKQSAATCAPNKEKTLDLIKIHENKINKAVNKDKDALKRIKVIKETNKAPLFLKMIIKSNHCTTSFCNELSDRAVGKN